MTKITQAQQEVNRLHKSEWFENQFKGGEYNDDITDDMRYNGIFFSYYDFEDGSAAIINHDGDCYVV